MFYSVITLHPDALCKGLPTEREADWPVSSNDLPISASSTLKSLVCTAMPDGGYLNSGPQGQALLATEPSPLPLFLLSHTTIHFHFL